ncbi:MAG: acetolactate synthase small subunit [Firmicutes bacterium]|uniref:Acetolactate synthase small subunit n=1 Tax=Candidatus Scybalomonas excrementavium TaxID=2840943 RepID=A0A9D9I266_9FIRM|nr:acetolactate synthase small subunit [Candidatus Scybalomonas excrementavium]
MKKRWLSLYVENDTGILAKVSGLFAGKGYNLESLTVGPTQDQTISRMTISLLGDDITFEQIKKQLNRMVGIIKVIDMTGIGIHSRELLLIKVVCSKKEEVEEVFRMAHVYHMIVVEYNGTEILLEGIHRDKQNQRIIDQFKRFKKIEIVRSGSAAVEWKEN